LQVAYLNRAKIMKATKIKEEEQKLESKSWILPGKSLTQDEFQAGIHKAEEGPFHTVQESMENFELWLKSREKK
jgi:hypothetical protein